MGPTPAPSLPGRVARNLKHPGREHSRTSTADLLYQAQDHTCDIFILRGREIFSLISYICLSYREVSFLVVITNNIQELSGFGGGGGGGGGSFI